MGPVEGRSRKLLPPIPVLIVVVGLVVLVPLGSWTLVGIRDWGYGGSPAAALDAPYFWGVLLLRLGGAIFLALLPTFLRTPASIWIAITSVWLAGPALQCFWQEYSFWRPAADSDHYHHRRSACSRGGASGLPS
ncbi:MAG: hypothetical protein QOK17_2395 [Sphingomonadales bacterium]|nr:hypothetical protein [Sphingomonadales bacterium]